MDIYPVFRASAQAYKLCHRTASPDQCSPIRPFRHCKFSQQAKQIVRDIVQLRDYLISHRKQYINIDCWLGGTSLMTDYERDRIDCQAQTLIKTCQHVVKNLKKIGETETVPMQVRLHQEAIVETITEFLKAVTKIYSEQKAIRIQRSVESRKLFRLENLVNYTSKLDERIERQTIDRDGGSEISKSFKATPSSSTVFENFADSETTVRRRKRSGDADRRSVTPSANTNEDDLKSQRIIQKTMHQKVDKAKLIALEADVESSKEEWIRVRQELKPEEVTQLELEGKNLAEEFTARVDEIKKLEGKVVEIAKLQDVFTEKVLQQEQDIYRINDVAIHTTENIRNANQSIREAMKKKANMRIYIIFVLMVLSFTLLFLDWYNP